MTTRVKQSEEAADLTLGSDRRQIVSEFGAGAGSQKVFEVAPEHLFNRKSDVGSGGVVDGEDRSVHRMSAEQTEAALEKSAIAFLARFDGGSALFRRDRLGKHVRGDAQAENLAQRPLTFGLAVAEGEKAPEMSALMHRHDCDGANALCREDDAFGLGKIAHEPIHGFSAAKTFEPTCKSGDPEGNLLA